MSHSIFSTSPVWHFLQGELENFVLNPEKSTHIYIRVIKILTSFVCACRHTCWQIGEERNVKFECCYGDFAFSNTSSSNFQLYRVSQKLCNIIFSKIGLIMLKDVWDSMHSSEAKSLDWVHQYFKLFKKFKNILILYKVIEFFILFTVDPM